MFVKKNFLLFCCFDSHSDYDQNNEAWYNSYPLFMIGLRRTTIQGRNFTVSSYKGHLQYMTRTGGRESQLSKKSLGHHRSDNSFV